MDPAYGEIIYPCLWRDHIVRVPVFYPAMKTGCKKIRLKLFINKWISERTTYGRIAKTIFIQHIMKAKMKKDIDAVPITSHDFDTMRQMYAPEEGGSSEDYDGMPDLVSSEDDGMMFSRR